MAVGPTRSRDVECPRCGYDLRGAAATWTDRCPIRGRCVECGLELDWRDIANPDYGLPAWLVESRRGIMRFPAQVVGTAARCLLPWSIWGQVRLVHPSRWGRVAAYLLALAVVLYVALAVTVAAMVAADHLRAAAAGGASSSAIETATLRALLLPLSTRSPGAVTYTTSRVFVVPMPSPWDHFVFFIARFLPVVAIVVAVMPATALAFAALPIARRRAKVRWRHVIRIAAYGMTLYLPVGLIALIGVVESVLSAGGGGLLGLIPLALLLLLPASLAWWLAAIRRYLRMQHPLAVTLSVVSIGWLTPIATAAAIWLLQ